MMFGRRCCCITRLDQPFDYKEVRENGEHEDDQIPEPGDPCRLTG
jgi:hypothetical protein